MEPSSDIARLLEIMVRLRDPQTGCAWDVVQTFETIAPYTIEEAYEVADAIERNDMSDLPDELGDLLLQVVFHARMGEELGKFDFGDVVLAITKKMIRRHPHVFGPEHQRDRKLAKGEWNRIKAEEKAEKLERHKAQANGVDGSDIQSLLDDVPRALPALMRALKLQQKAATVGFDWDTAPPILDKIEEETGELRQAIADEGADQINEEYGDLLFAVVNLGRHLDLNPEAALDAASMKFKARFSYIEKSLAERGRSPAKSTLAEMEELWVAAKQNGKAS
ncbi:MAG: nucleoside triphosphate pyrophosphohydrolase [Pseudomonadota bacterium]